MRLNGLYQKRGVWYYRPPQRNGVRPRAVSLRTRDAAEARKIWESLSTAEAVACAPGLLSVEIPRYLEHQRQRGRHGPQTSYCTANRLRIFADAIGPAREVRSVTRAEVEGFLARYPNAATRRSRAGSLQGFFSWAVREGMARVNPATLPGDSGPLPTRMEKYCSPVERDRLISAAAGDWMEPVFWLGFFAGLRPGEIGAVRRDWIDLHGGVLHVRVEADWKPKGKRARMIRLGPRLSQFLAGYLDRSPGSPRDFLIRPEVPPGPPHRRRLNFDHRFARAVAACGLGWVKPHTMRHTFATLHAIAGTPLAMIARELGDEFGTVYEHYVGYSKEGSHAGSID